MPYRGAVEEFANSLSYSASPISADQSEGLISLMATVSENYEFTSELGSRDGRGRAWRNREVSQDDLNIYSAEREEYDSMVLGQASGVLNEDQLSALAERQFTEREREIRQFQFRIDNPSSGSGGGGPRGRF